MSGTRYPRTAAIAYAPRKRSLISEAIDDAGHEPDRPTYPAHPLPDGPERHVVLVFPAPAKPLSVNQTNGRHYGTHQLDKRLWEAAGRDAAEDNAELLAPYRGHRVELTFCLPLVQRKQADGQNYASGISVKAAVDGITRTGLLIPKDTSEWVTVDCVFWDGGPSKDEARVRVRGADAPWDGSL